jgi:hypothetical protein
MTPALFGVGILFRMEDEAMWKIGQIGSVVALFLAVAAGAGFAQDALGVDATAGATTRGTTTKAGAGAGSSGRGAPAALRSMIGSLVLGKPLGFQGLTIIPITTLTRWTPIPVVTLDEALKKRWLRIREIDDGEVPMLVLDNKSDRTVFIMGGEIVTGGKQDRLVGSDALIRPHARGVRVPVYCVEAGRWTETTAQFSTKENLGTWSLRSNAQASAPAAQESIWGEVEKMQAKAGARSATGAYQDIYEDRKLNARLQALEAGLKNVPSLAAGTVGAICALGGRVLSMDVFADASAFQQLWPKILRASALSAVTAAAEESAGHMTRDNAWSFLEQVSDLRFSQEKGVDLGVEVRAAGRGITASALVHDGVVLHLSAFPLPRESPERQQAPGFAPGLEEDDTPQGRE